ncbi:MAG: HipA domain-containing protein [Cryomorphaceae bacterium]
MGKKCLFCYKVLEGETEYHKKCAEEFFGEPNPPEIEYSLSQMDDLAKNIVERSVSVPGVQAKLSMSLIKSTKENSNTRLTVIGMLGGQYIFKPPSDQYPEMPANEHLTMRIAEAFGIKVVPSSLIRLQSGELSYITRRVDRTSDNEKVHMLDMFQITEAFDKYRSSMERVGKAIELHSANTLLDQILYLELAIFSFLFGNNDMHLKNFSMLQSESGWTLSPAYDLLNAAIINPEDQEESALTLQGKKKKLKRKHFESLGDSLGLTNKQIAGAFKRMLKNKPKADELIAESFLSKAMKENYLSLINERYVQLGLITDDIKE